MNKIAMIAVLVFAVSQLAGCSEAKDKPGLDSLSEALGPLPSDAKLLWSGAQVLSAQSEDIEQDVSKSRFWIVLSSKPLPIPIQRDPLGQSEVKSAGGTTAKAIDVGPLKNFIAANYSEHSSLPRMDAAKATCIEWQNDNISIRLRECHEASQWLSVVEIIPVLHQEFTSIH